MPIPHKPRLEQPIGRSEVGNEERTAGLSARNIPLAAACPASASFTMPPASNTNSFSYDELAILFDDVCALKRVAIDFRKQTSEIEQLWSQLDGMKSQMEHLWTRRSEIDQDRVWNDVERQIQGINEVVGDVREVASAPTSEVAPGSRDGTSSLVKGSEETHASVAAATLLDDATDPRRVSGQQVATADSWRFGETCWDAAALIGRSSVLLLPETIILIFLCVLTACIQGCFIIIIFLSLSDSPINQETIDGFHLWRTFAGHDIRYTNVLTSESLTSRVCRHDASLPLSDSQAKHLSEIENYLEVHSPFNGPMMCLLATFTWILTIFKEFHILLDMWIALSSLPRNCGTFFVYVEGGLLLRAFHPARLLWIFFLSCVRLCISGSLLVAGFLFLSATYEISEILLNAVALEFVINVDELLYAALAPRRTRKTVSMIMPIPLPRSQQWRGLDVRMLLTAIACIGLLCAVIPSRLIPEMTKMRDAKDELCKGYKGFSYGLAMGSPLWAAGPLTVNEEIRNLYASGKYRIIRGVIENGEDANVRSTNPTILPFKAMNVFSDFYSVHVYQNTPTIILSNWVNPSCIDLPLLATGSTLLPGGLLIALRDAIRNQSVKRCSDVAMHCNKFDGGGQVVRVVCASTCGCNRPGSSLALPRDLEGCPQACPSSQTYIAQQQARQCTQPPMSLLVNDRLWREFGDAWVQASKSFTTSNLVAQAARRFVLKGCEAIHETGGSSSFFCQPVHISFKSLSFWCPLYCGCNTTSRRDCPQKCKVNEPIPLGNQTPSDL